MKKKLLFFSLVVFTFILAGSVRAAVNNVTVVSLPADGELNYLTTKPITWTYDGNLTAPRFNISIFAGAETLPIATQVSSNPAADGSRTFNWKVGRLKSGRFTLGREYKIKVCVVGVNPVECGESSSAFKIIPPALTAQWQVLDLFKKAMDKRYSDLNSNGKTGAQGVYDYIISKIKITKDAVNADKVYADTVLEQLDWFKAEFLKNTDNVLETKDKAGIKQAMSRRYSDLCAIDWNSTKNNETSIYNRAVASAEKARKGVRAKAAVGTTPASPATGAELCLAVYNAGVKAINVAPNLYDSATKKFIARQELQNEKDLCLTGEYKKLYEAKKGALSAFNGAVAARTTTYNTCANNRISDLNNWQ